MFRFGFVIRVRKSGSACAVLSIVLVGREALRSAWCMLFWSVDLFVYVLLAANVV